jgi:predicted transcriptional regulator
MSDLTIRPFIEKNSVMIKCDTPIKDVINLFIQHRITGAPVINNDLSVIGFVSEKDCIGKLLLAAYYCDQMPSVNDVMSTKVVAMSPDDKILDVAKIMAETPPKLYPVIENGKCIGVISRANILKALFTHVDHCFK